MTFGVFKTQFILSTFVAGVFTELVYHNFYGRLHERGTLRIFGFLIPVVFFIPYIFISLLNNPTWWSIHMVVGLVVVNGMAGSFLTYLIIPPGQKNYLPFEK